MEPKKQESLRSPYGRHWDCWKKIDRQKEVIKMLSKSLRWVVNALAYGDKERLRIEIKMGDEVLSLAEKELSK